MANMSLAPMHSALFGSAQVFLADDQRQAFLSLPMTYQASQDRELRNYLFLLLDWWARRTANPLNSHPQLEAVQEGDADAQREFLNPDTGEVLRPWIRIKFRRKRRGE